MIDYFVMLLVFATGCAPQVAYNYDGEAESRFEAEILGPPQDTSLDILALSPEIQARCLTGCSSAHSALIQ